MAMNRYLCTGPLQAVWIWACSVVCLAGVEPEYLFPDLFPYVEENAQGDLATLQNWRLEGNEIRFNTLFANQGDGVFEIRKGANLNPDENELLQRVYLDNDYTGGPNDNFVDLNIGISPTPGAGTPFPTDFNVIWFEDFTRFSLHEALVVDGSLTVGNEVAGDTKMSWRLSPNTGPLPGYEGLPRNSSSNLSEQQRIGVGWADLYRSGSLGQFIDITGVPAGPLYWLRQHVDPANRITETDETNNSYEVLIDLSNPGFAIRRGYQTGTFFQPGDAQPGDLNGDGQLNAADWAAFKASAETDLTGLSEEDAYLLGDLNLDGRHSLADASIFREYYELANGAGSFAAINSTVPEPASAIFAAAAAIAVCYVGRRKLYRARRALLVALTITTFLVASSPQPVVADITIWSEDFESVTLLTSPQEDPSRNGVWTDTPPAGWSVDDSGVPGVGDSNQGVEDWEGWAFVDEDFWVDAEQGQLRENFRGGLADGVIAVAEVDEWDDLGSPADDIGFYNAFMTSPQIDISSSNPNTLRLKFASSWRDECCDDGDTHDPNGNNQTAIITASYDGGAAQEILRWESDSSDGNPFFKNDAPNELVELPLSNPAASTVQFEFGLVDAGNDWWWAVDNLELVVATPPPSLEVNTTTGELTVLNAADLTGYEVIGPTGSLDEVSWSETNLDARNVGSSVTADFNNDHKVTLADYTTWRDNLGNSTAGDSDGDGMTTASDYQDWKLQFGAEISEGDSWELLAGSDGRLSEFYLNGQTSDSALSIGQGYNTVANLGNLQFFYSTPDDLEIEGLVSYVGGGGERRLTFAAQQVPEPQSWLLIASLLAVGSCVRHRVYVEPLI